MGALMPHAPNHGAERRHGHEWQFALLLPGAMSIEGRTKRLLGFFAVYPERF